MKRSAPPARAISPPAVKRKIESTTTSKAVASFFKPASQKEPENLVWRTVEQSLIIGRYEPSGPSPQQRTLPVKIAAFDLDDTLITSKESGKTWSRSALSWKWWNTSIPGKLKSLHNEGYLIIILSNQSTISLKDNKKSLQKDMASVVNFKSQLSAILQQLDFPLSVYAATSLDKYRKPRIGMWEEVLDDYDLQAEGAVDMANSFYIGDAAGREKTDKRRKDHATSDRDLAANIGIRFLTPDEFFLGAATEPYDHLFEPETYLQPTENAETAVAVSAPFTMNSKQELVIFCGSPGAGKSTFFWDGKFLLNNAIAMARASKARRQELLLEC
ncbi:DNA kinase/phosphatase Pnk1 [Cladophialophora chaetospira]|uniref:DNA kinase/phosphatase Pnk1 n=1 Tax=Cladophialophora chaetospira TaxID=386627 RepID=A0AA38X6V3_9EURO|nr:DNA kinase/phosphatase Pnk1 [Cladophialophora chaetospira]